MHLASVFRSLPAMSTTSALVFVAAAAACSSQAHHETAPVEAAARPASEANANAAPTSIAVHIDRTEFHLRLDADGSVTQELREVYRVVAGNLPEPWASVYAFWRPWIDEPPEVNATVVRPDGTVSQLDPATVVDQPAPRDDGLISDARMRLAPLPGLTPGATVERKITTTTRDLFGAGRLVGLSLASAQPEASRIIVVDVPASLPLAWQGLNTDIEPRRETHGDRVVLTFERGAVEPYVGHEVLAPRDTDDQPVLRFSTAPSWRSVAAAWTARAENQIDASAVRSLALRLTRKQQGRDDKVRAVLAWVRSNVRYTGLELGAAAWVPTTTAEVLQRRYGDCKDLSLLVVAMLRSIGIAADVALVRTDGLDVTEQAPGLALFDHAIVRLRGRPNIWIDPTAPFSAYGEVPWNIAGRKALVARMNTARLIPVTPHAESTLETTVEIFFAPDGPARLVRTRRSDGTLYTDGRDAAAQSMDNYRQALETFAKEGHDSEENVSVEASDPFAPGPFREVLDIPDSHQAVTEGDAATAPLQVDLSTAALAGILYVSEHGGFDDRKDDLALVQPGRARVANVLHPPIGFRMDDLPADVDETIGPVHVALRWKRGDDRSVSAILGIEAGAGVLKPKDAERLVNDILPKVIDVRARFQNIVLAEIGKERYHTAVREAEAVLRTDPSPSARAQLAYALSIATFQEAALAEARTALAEAPDDVQVRNRATFVLLHNERGVEMGAGYPRDEALEIVLETIRRFPRDEWARRLRISIMRHAKDGLADGANVDREALLAEIRAYREETKATNYDGTLITLLVRKRVWKRVLEEMPEMDPSRERNAAWLSADIVVNGLGQSLRRAVTESRLDDETLGLTTQYLLATRQYEKVAGLFEWIDAKAGNPNARTFAAALRELRACHLERSDPRWTIVQLGLAGLGDTRVNIDRLFTEKPPEGVRRGLLHLGSGVAGAAGLANFDLKPMVCDVYASAVRADLQPVSGFGQLLTLRTEFPGITMPPPMIVRKRGKGWAIVPNPSPELAAAALDAHRRGNRARTEELVRVVARLDSNPPGVIRGERAGWYEMAPFYAARVAASAEATRAAARAFAEAQLDREDLNARQVVFATRTLTTALADAARQRRALGERLRKKEEPETQHLGMTVLVRALRDLGKFEAARRVLDTELSKRPHDVALLEMRELVAGDLGDFATARRIAAELAETLHDTDDEGGHLNNAAWYSIFNTADEEAARQAERSVELRATTASLNTLAAVYASLGRWDDAVRAMRRQVYAQSDVDAEELDPSYWFVRGRIAEAFNRPSTAAALYSRVEPAANGSADDTYPMAKARLKRLRRAPHSETSRGRRARIPLAR